MLKTFHRDRRRRQQAEEEEKERKKEAEKRTKEDCLLLLLPPYPSRRLPLCLVDTSSWLPLCLLLSLIYHEREVRGRAEDFF